MSRHSNYLRIRVVNYIKNGGTKLQASKTFQLARQTVITWCTLDKEDNLFRVIPRLPNCKLNTNDVLDYVKQNPDRYNYEIAREFNCSPESIRQFLKRHRISNKKTNNLP